jgi:hypothetical protein
MLGIQTTLNRNIMPHISAPQELFQEALSKPIYDGAALLEHCN